MAEDAGNGAEGLTQPRETATVKAEFLPARWIAGIGRNLWAGVFLCELSSSSVHREMTFDFSKINVTGQQAKPTHPVEIFQGAAITDGNINDLWLGPRGCSARVARQQG